MRVSNFPVHAALLAIGVSASVGAPAFAQDDQRSAALARIGTAGIQSILIQTMARDICLAELGIDADANMAQFRAAKERFSAAHTNLKDGNAEAGLAPIENAAIVEAWEDADRRWTQLNEAYAAVDGTTPIEQKDFDEIIRGTGKLFKEYETLIAEMRDDAVSGREVVDGASAAGLVYYSRQAMLAARMTKEACQLVRGDWGDGPRFEMLGTEREFEEKLDFFLRGNPLHGVPSPATPEIQALLRDALDNWTTIKAQVIKTVDGGPLSQGELVVLEGQLTLIEEKFGEVVERFGEAAAN